MIFEASRLHYKAVTGSNEAKAKAFSWLEKAWLEDSENQLLTAYYADCLSMIGYASKDSAAMFANAIKAMKLFDSSVNMDPNTLLVRFLRAYHSFRLPQSFFQRTATAINDWEFLAKSYEEDSSLFSKGLYEDTLFLLGKAYFRMNMENEAKAVWEKLLASTDNQAYRKLVQEELRKNSSYYLNVSMDSTAVTLENGIRLHDLAVAGCKKASQSAFEILQKVFERNPEDPVAEGYYGSAMALAARDSGDTGRMFGSSIKAIQHLKRAVSKRMYDPKLRLMRGYLLYSLPDVFFHLSGKAAKDFKFLKSAYENDNSIFSKEQYWRIMYDLGVCYKNTGDDINAEKVWKRLLKECPENRYREMIQGPSNESVDPGEVQQIMPEPLSEAADITEISEEIKTDMDLKIRNRYPNKTWNK